MQQQAERSGSGMPAQPLQRASRSNSFTSAISQLADPGAITRSASQVADPQVGPCGGGGGGEQGHAIPDHAMSPGATGAQQRHLHGLLCTCVVALGCTVPRHNTRSSSSCCTCMCFHACKLQLHTASAPQHLSSTCRLLQGGYASAPVSNPLYDGPDEASHALEARVRAVEEVLQRGGSGGQLVLPHSGSLDLSMPGRVPELAASVGGRYAALCCSAMMPSACCWGCRGCLACDAAGAAWLHT
jgi:hypothetical protein